MAGPLTAAGGRAARPSALSRPRLSARPSRSAAEELIGDRRTGRSAGSNINKARRWQRRRAVRVFEGLSYLGAVLLIVAVVWSLVMMASGSPGILKNVNDRCDHLSLPCGTVTGFAIPVLSVALASAVFLFYRLRHVKSPVAREARNKPHTLVETAGPNIGEIVGRDPLCQVIMEDIRSRSGRRPHVVVGGVGTGKTAVLVRLTKLLADQGAIPVPIRLRDAQKELNFREMAYERFRSKTESRLVSTGEAEKVWRQLCKDDQVVIIADGLEEALSEGSAEKDRDNLIRLAIHHARELGLPLVIASRPHDPLRGADATIMELEPLSEEAALTYISKDARSDDLRRLDWIVETAGLAELPLYLQITRQLCRHDRLDHLTARQGSKKLNTRSLDRSQLRLNLLDTWIEALLDGHLMPTVPLSRDEREATVVWLSALACIGLKKDSIDVKFEEYTDEPKDAPRRTPADSRPLYPKIDEVIRGELEAKLHGRSLDIRLAAAWGDRLNLVNAHGDGLRFPHSIMQAYLGSRFMRTALEDPVFFEDASVALKDPGREFLIALVLYCRRVASAPKPPPRRELEAPGAARLPITTGPAMPSPPPKAPRQRRGAAKSPAALSRPGPGAEPVTAAARVTMAAPAQPAESPQPCSDVPFIRDLLQRRAGDATDGVKALDLYAAALEIDSFLDQPDHEHIAASIVAKWKTIQGGDQRTLDEAKLRLVYRFGDAVRTIANRHSQPRSTPAPPADGRINDLPAPAYLQLFEIGRLELSYPIRLAVAQEIGAGGDIAFRILHDRLRDTCPTATQEEDHPRLTHGKKKQRRGPSEIPGKAEGPARPGDDTGVGGHDRTLSAWLAPLLVGSVDKYREQAQQVLGQWLQWVRRNNSASLEVPLHLSVEIALAQGFKHAANRRRRHPHARPETRVYLAEQAMEMLKNASFWFSQLTLIHALCLWEMPEPDLQRLDNAASRSHAGDTKRLTDRRGSNPEAIVGDWLETARSGKHPFVAAASELAVRALQTAEPERFLWIDESGIVGKVGSLPAQGTQHRKHNLWIPPSAGWASLEPRAQQLVADVLLLLNLAERGQQPQQIEQRLKRTDGIRLPPCLTGDRYPLDPKRTVGAADMSAPGTNCKDGCSFRLCPYPPSGIQSHRAELSEAFSRRQRTLLSRAFRSKAAPWQAAALTDLKDFWAQMADRARGGSSSHEFD
jgi:hypothetical protein